MDRAERTRVDGAGGGSAHSVVYAPVGTLVEQWVEQELAENQDEKHPKIPGKNARKKSTENSYEKSAFF